MLKGTFASLVLAALAVSACGGSGSGGTGSSGGAPAGSTAVSLTEWKILPAKISVKAGSVTFYIKNDGTTQHDFVIQDSSSNSVGKSKLLDAGDSQTLTLTLPAGSYNVVCDVPGHKESGMVGSITAT